MSATGPEFNLGFERYRQNAEAGYQRLDQLLARLDDQTPDNDEGATT